MSQSNLDINGGATLQRSTSRSPSRPRRTSELEPLLDLRRGTIDVRGRKDRRTRFLMLACACLLSLGSHFGSHVLGPLKTSLETSEAGFASLQSAGELVNSITPFLIGVLVPRYGVAQCGIVATGAVLLGQTIVACAERARLGDHMNLSGMIVGFLLSGAGASPLSVVQESIVLRASVRQNTVPGLAVALCLVVGKTASFISAASSKPLANIAPRLPFIVAASLSLVSFLACVFYIILERSLDLDADDESENGEEERAKDRSMSVAEIVTFPTRYWLFAVVCGFVGVWTTTIHLSSSFVQRFYGVSPVKAGAAASVIAFASIILYPTLGFALDKRPQILRGLFLAIPLTIAASLSILLWLVHYVPYFLAFVPAALGIGCGPLLVVIVVPRLVEQHQVATALGLHKSLEMAGGVIVQFLASIALSSSPDKVVASAAAAKLLLALALVQFVVMIIWWQTIRASRTARRYEEPEDYVAVSSNEVDDTDTDNESLDLPATSPKAQARVAAHRRGKISFGLSCAFIATAWGIFIYNWIMRVK